MPIRKARGPRLCVKVGLLWEKEHKPTTQSIVAFLAAAFQGVVALHSASIEWRATGTTNKESIWPAALSKRGVVVGERTLGTTARNGR